MKSGIEKEEEEREEEGEVCGESSDVAAEIT